MASFTAKNAAQLRARAGTKSEILASEFALVDAAIDTAKINIVDLTASAVSSTNLAANGVALASGTNHTFYSVFVAPVACTIVSMDVLITEAYKKETTDAKIELKTEASSPVTKCTTTLAAAGVAAKTIINVAPTDATLAAGTILNIVTTESASSTGTGHAKVFMRYIIN